MTRDNPDYLQPAALPGLQENQLMMNVAYRAAGSEQSQRESPPNVMQLSLPGE